MGKTIFEFLDDGYFVPSPPKHIYKASFNFLLLLRHSNLKTVLFTILNTTKIGTIEIKAQCVCSQVQEEMPLLLPC